MLRYRETFWRYKTGFKIRKVELTIDTVDASKTREDQQARIEKISLVAFLSEKRKKCWLPYADVLKKITQIFIKIIIPHAEILDNSRLTAAAGFSEQLVFVS